MSYPRSVARIVAVARIMLVVAVAVAVVFAANALLRPGCSLLPVVLPRNSSPEGSDGAPQPLTLEQACGTLGRPLPQATILPDGVERSALLYASPPPFYAPRGVRVCICTTHPRIVTVSYAKSGRGAALLTIVQGNIQQENVRDINGTVAGVPAIITQSRPLVAFGHEGTDKSATDFDDVAYLWAREGLLFTLHVQLAPGITREAADAMAASIR